ncbi:uncharacterized protein LOC107418062 [Ziziphus jujuba]|uniref:Uncharacterized protein LOC107418062 n=1 Tax=Ziziphus jujuba TaxID=326968 RepID=A0A6P3ZS08_ZIZJJ|nr:uncharacterized protein LOC107418062 [Ziziphus jujuba]
MGSIPHHFYSDYPFELSGFSGLASAAGGPVVPETNSNGGGAMWGDQDSLIPMIDNGVLDDLSPESSDMAAAVPSSMMAVSSFPEQLGVLDGVVPASFSDHYSMSGLHGISGMQNFGVGYQQDACEFGEECCGLFMPEYKPVGLVARENWGIQSNQIHSLEESNIKVGRYSEEERKERILRYLKKRNQRNFNKTIKYACRKTLADRRVRVRGRFARNNELCDQEMVAKKNESPTRKDRELCCGDAVQMKYDEDQDWLQEAMANLLCLPYVAG